MKTKLKPKPETRTKIKVFLIDDHPTVREGVRSFLGLQGLEVVGEASDDTEAVRKLKKVKPDVIILDINLPGVDGGELARLLRSTIPSAQLIAFSIHASQEYVVRMARCGVHGYVMKDAPTENLVEAIERVHRGGIYFPPGMTDAILAPGFKPSPDAKAVLTAREREVLVLLAVRLRRAYADAEAARDLLVGEAFGE